MATLIDQDEAREAQDRDEAVRLLPKLLARNHAPLPGDDDLMRRCRLALHLTAADVRLLFEKRTERFRFLASITSESEIEQIRQDGRAKIEQCDKAVADQLHQTIERLTNLERWHLHARLCNPSAELVQRRVWAEQAAPDAIRENEAAMAAADSILAEYPLAFDIDTTPCAGVCNTH